MLEMRRSQGVAAIPSSHIVTMAPLADGGTDLEIKGGGHVQVCESIPQIKAMIATPFVPATQRPRPKGTMKHTAPEREP
jgi:hypothetical protein